MKPAYLIDLDGTLYAGDNPIPHAPEFIHYLKQENRPYLLVTNCPSRTAAQVVEKLAGLSIHVPERAVLTSGMAAAMYLKEQGLERVFLLGGESVRQELESRSIGLVQENSDCVLVAWDKNFSYEKLERAARQIRNGAVLVCTNPDKVIPGNLGPVPHSGSLCAAVESASGACAVMLGKPGPHMARYALALLGTEPQNTIMVGDLQETDIRFANNNGMRGALMLTGLTGREDISSQDPPTFVFESLSDLVAHDRENYL